MKTNWLIILLIIVGGSTINLGITLRYGNPSIEFIDGEEFVGKNSDMFVYSIKLRSNENLKNFKVNPSIKGINKDSYFNFDFNENTHQAIINYFYVLPDDFDKNNEVILTFTLTDSKESNVRTKIIDFSKNKNFVKKGKNKENLTQI